MKKFLLGKLSNLFIAFQINDVKAIIDKYNVIPPDFYLSYFAGYYLNPKNDNLMPIIDLNNLYNIIPSGDERKMLIINNQYALLLDDVDKIVEAKAVSVKRSKKIEEISFKTYIKTDKKVIPIIDLSEIESKMAKEKRFEKNLQKRKKILPLTNEKYRNEEIPEKVRAGEKRVMLVFQYGNKNYGVETQYGYYIANRTRMVPYPYTDKISGLINLHGEMINILSAEYAYGDEETDTDKFVIIDYDDIKLGLKTEKIISIYKIDESKMIDKKNENSFIKYIYRDDAEILVLDIENMVKSLIE